MIYKSAIIISSISFIFYGFNCLYSKAMVNEFRRFGLSNGQRKLTGILQLFGGLGLAIGYFTSAYILLFASVGLCLLMLIGFGVRLKIRDSLLESLPSFIFALINAYLVFITYTNALP